MNRLFIKISIYGKDWPFWPFQWAGSGDTFGSVGIDALLDSSSGLLNVYCVVKDDDGFSFPSDVKAQIGSSGGNQ